MRWLETVALGFFVYELTGSPFWVAFVGLIRMLPMFVLGAFVGVIADRIDRRLILDVGHGSARRHVCRPGRTCDY